MLLHGTTLDPAKRFGSGAEVKTWSDSATASYAQRSGISLSIDNAGGEGASSGGGTINSEGLPKFQNGSQLSMSNYICATSDATLFEEITFS